MKHKLMDMHVYRKFYSKWVDILVSLPKGHKTPDFTAFS